MSAFVLEGRFECAAVSTLEGLAEHATAWDELAVRCAHQGGLSATYPWFASFVEHRLADSGRDWSCLFLYEDGALRGVLPLVRRPHLLLRGARAWLDVPGDEHASGGDLLLDAPDEGRAMLHLLALLGEALGSRPPPMGLRLGGLVSSAPTRVLLGEVKGALIAEEDAAGRSIDLRATWEGFHGALGSNFRRNLRKARNRLEREGRVTFEHATDAASLERFLALEAKGWKGADGGAVGANESARGFYRAFCERLAARGWLAWHFLTLDGATLAASLAIRWGNQIVLQRVAYDEAHARTSPGQLLLAHALEGWFADASCERLDCLTDQPWHATWNMERMPYASATITHGWVGYLAGALPARLRLALRGVGPLRRLVRRVRGEPTS